MYSFLRSYSEARTITLVALSGGIIATLVSLVAYLEVNVPRASADDVTTSVTVLNTPPAWTTNAEESTASATTTPTNSGSVITWIGTGTDSSSDNYYLIICKTFGAPTANSGAPPTCNGGVANQWAVSASTASASQASAATTTKETFPFDAEKNDWYAYICDGNASLPRCNVTVTQGNGTEVTSSPFVINHPPVFSLISNDTPVDPGDTMTWTTTSYDNDNLGGSQDTVQLFVCKSNNFNGTTCPSPGGWATSTVVTTNAATTSTIVIPTQDGLYNAYVYIVDNHSHQATSTNQTFNSSFTVNNITPTVSAATISLDDQDDVGNLTLDAPNATSGPFKVRFTAVDNNSCLNLSAGNELTTAIANIYRSGIGQSACNESGEYNSNDCYVYASPFFSNHITCTQDGGSCSGSSDSDATWTCNFNFWFNADPTDASTPWTAENWLASVQISDDDFATSTLTEGTSGNEMTSFLAFNVSSTSIPYGSLEPGAQSAILATSTDLLAWGNVGLDEDLYGDTMCPAWSAADSCDTNGFQAASDIPIANQKVATTTRTYTHPESYAMTGSTTPLEMTLRVPKTTATSSPNVRYSFWGIAIPIAITTAGSYTGQNTLTAKKSPSAFW